MIDRLFPPGASFTRLCRYLCQDTQRAEVIDQEGVRGHDHQLMARDFELIHSLHPERQKVTFHAVLDFHRQEKVDDRRMVEIGRKYLAEIGMRDTQYAIVKHTDTRHLHMHLVANRIDYQGKFLYPFPEILRSKEAVQKLVREHGLMPAEKKHLRETNWEALKGTEKELYKLYRIISENLSGCRSLEELEGRLLPRGIDIRYRFDEETGERRGISFRYEDRAFKGSRIDREFSLPRLEQVFAQRQELALWEKQKLALRKEESLKPQSVQEPSEALKKEIRQEELQETQQPDLSLRKSLRQDTEEEAPVRRLRLSL